MSIAWWGMYRLGKRPWRFYLFQVSHLFSTCVSLAHQTHFARVDIQSKSKAQRSYNRAFEAVGISFFTAYILMPLAFKRERHWQVQARCAIPSVLLIPTLVHFLRYNTNYHRQDHLVHYQQ